MVLLGDRVVLRPISDDDTADIIRWRNSQSVRKNFIYRKPFTQGSHENWLKTAVETGKAIQFIIYTKEDNISVGSSYLRDIDYINRKAEYGIFMGEEGRGRGIGTETARLILKYGFEELHLHKIFLRVFSENLVAIKSYQKAGFIVEGHQKDEVFLDGVYKDILFMAKINSE